MKIGFVGAPSTGKSSLSRDLSRMYPEAAYIPEVRKVEALMAIPSYVFGEEVPRWEDNQDIDLLSDWAKSHYDRARLQIQRDRELVYKNGEKGFIADTASFMCWIYLLCLSGHHLEKRKGSQILIEMEQEAIKHVRETFDLLVYLPPFRIPFTANNHRPFGVTMNKVFDATLRRYLDFDLGGKVITILTRDRQESLGKIDWNLKMRGLA